MTAPARPEPTRLLGPAADAVSQLTSQHLIAAQSITSPPDVIGARIACARVAHRRGSLGSRVPGSAHSPLGIIDFGGELSIKLISRATHSHILKSRVPAQLFA